MYTALDLYTTMHCVLTSAGAVFNLQQAACHTLQNCLSTTMQVRTEADLKKALQDVKHQDHCKK